jgi:hypothetical protein
MIQHYQCSQLPEWGKGQEEHVFICMHHRTLPIGSAWLDGIGVRDAEALLENSDR